MKGHAASSPAAKALPVKVQSHSRLYSFLQVLGAVSFFVVCFISGKTQTMMSNSQIKSVNSHILQRVGGISEDLQLITVVSDQSSNELQVREGKPGPLVVVSIQASEGTMDILERLLGTLEHPQIAVIIHLDEKARHKEHEQLDEMVLRFRLHPSPFCSISILYPSQTVTYRGSVMVDVTLRIMETFVRKFSEWRFFINLSAQDYLLCRSSELVELLSELPENANFMSVDHSNNWPILFSRVTTVVLDESLYRGDAFWKVNLTSEVHRKYPSLFRPYHGEAWHVLSRPFCEYVSESTDGFPRRLFAFYANAPSSPEGYFQSLLCHSAFENTLVNDCMRYVDWSLPTQHPPDIAERHLSFLKEGGALFARKFSDPEVINQVNAQVLRTVPAGLYNSSVTVHRIRQRLQQGLAGVRGCSTIRVNAAEAQYVSNSPYLRSGTRSPPYLPVKSGVLHAHGPP